MTGSAKSGDRFRDHYKMLVKSITEFAIVELSPLGIVATWNLGAERIIGYTEDEVVGQYFSRFFTLDDKVSGKPSRALNHAKRAGRFEEEGWRVRKDASQFWASTIIWPIEDKTGIIIGFANITRDINKMRTSHEALLTGEKRLQLFMDNVVHHAMFMLDNNGFIVDWNRGAEEIKGYKRAEIIGQHYSVFFTAEDQERGRPAQALAVARSSGRFEEEGWRLRKNGSKFWARVVLTPMWDEHGKQVGFAKITRDITEQRALAEARLYSSQKMEAVGQLTAGIAHDFNNLLSVVVGSLELIGKHSHDRERVTRLAATAGSAAAQGAKLVSQLLAFSGRQNLKPRTGNINNLITAVEAVLQRACGENVELRVKLCHHLWHTQLDGAHFQSAILNLVVNARDAIPSSGKIEIETQNFLLEVTAENAKDDIAPGHYILVTVKDNGIGMTPEILSRAIEPYFTTKAVGEGSGLGLSQAYGFVRQSQGQMKIESQFGLGTVISIYLPMSTSSPEVERPPQGRTFNDKINCATILVVEDDLGLLSVATEALEDIGYRVCSAKDGRSALLLLKGDISIDLLFTDIVMPDGISGLELADHASKLRPQLKVLLTSGYPRQIIEESERVDSSRPFIAKPYTLAVLQEALHKALAMDR